MAETGDDGNKWRSQTPSRVISDEAHEAGFHAMVGVIIKADQTGRRVDANQIVDRVISQSRSIAQSVKITDALGAAVGKSIESMRASKPDLGALQLFEQAMNAYREGVEQHLGIGVAADKTISRS